MTKISKKIAITGGTGVLGSLFIKKCSPLYHIYNFLGDLRNIQEIENWLLSIGKIDALFHFASIVPVNEVKKQPFDAYDVNVGGTINLLNGLKKIKTKPWLFYCSSSHVYSSKTNAIKETDKIEPISIYGKTKACAEDVVISFKNQKKYDVCIGRVFSFYHKNQSVAFLYPSIKEKIKTHNYKNDFELLGAENIRDFLPAEMVVKIILDLYESRSKGIYNIASGIPISIKDFVLRHIDSRLKIKHASNQNSNSLYADITKLNKIYE